MCKFFRSYLGYNELSVSSRHLRNVQHCLKKKKKPLRVWKGQMARVVTGLRGVWQVLVDTCPSCFPAPSASWLPRPTASSAWPFRRPCPPGSQLSTEQNHKKLDPNCDISPLLICECCVLKVIKACEIWGPENQADLLPCRKSPGCKQQGKNILPTIEKCGP